MKPLRWLESFWFEPAPARRLALFRILFGLYALWRTAGEYPHLVSTLRQSAQPVLPVGLMRLVDGAPAPAIGLALLAATALANLAFVLGWRYRLSGPLFGVGYLAFFCYTNSFGMIYHSENPAVLHGLVLGLAPAADAYSLDARRRAGRGQRGATAESWRYGWPIRLICACTASIYFLAGIAKVAGSLGFAWMGGESLRSHIATDAIRKTVLGDTPGVLGAVALDHPLLLTGIGVVTLIVELGAPLFFFAGRWPSRLWAAMTWNMHVGIFLIMGITFRYAMLGLPFFYFFPIEQGFDRLVARWRAHRGDGG